MSARPVKTFSIGFKEAGYDEAAHARAVARHLGTDHTELYVTMGEAMAVIPRLPAIYDEPFADASQIPTFLVAELARRHVTVALSGDGGDELFAGYNRYALAERLLAALSRTPAGAQHALSRLVTGVSPERWDRLLGLPLAAVARPAAPVARRRQAAQGGRCRHPRRRGRHLSGPHLPLAAPRRDRHRRQGAAPAPGGTAPAAPVRRMMLDDLTGYLPDDILVKVDRATMAVWLESRVPLLDHRIVAFSWSLPMDIVRRDGQIEVAAASGALPLRAARAHRAAENGLRRADRHLAPRAAADPGPRTSFRRAASSARASSGPSRSARLGMTISAAIATFNTGCGRCSCSRPGSRPRPRAGPKRARPALVRGRRLHDGGRRRLCGASREAGRSRSPAGAECRPTPRP